MIFQLAKGLFSAAAVWLLQRYRRLSLDLLKIQGVTYYVQGVQGVRQLTLALLAVAFLLALGAAGFILLHVGLAAVVYGLSGSWILTGGVLIALGAGYLGAMIWGLRRYVDERNWMRWSGAGRLVDEVTRGNKQD